MSKMIKIKPLINQIKNNYLIYDFIIFFYLILIQFNLNIYILINIIELVYLI